MQSCGRGVSGIWGALSGNQESPMHTRCRGPLAGVVGQQDSIGPPALGRQALGCHLSLLAAAFEIHARKNQINNLHLTPEKRHTCLLIALPWDPCHLPSFKVKLQAVCKVKVNLCYAIVSLLGVCGAAQNCPELREGVVVVVVETSISFHPWKMN